MSRTICNSCGQELEEKTYDVFYGSTASEWQAWSQHQTVTAPTFKLAAVKASKNSHHQNGTRYLVVGPDDIVRPELRETKRGRVFEVNAVRTKAEADLSYQGGALGLIHYVVTEAPVVDDKYRGYGYGSR